MVYQICVFGVKTEQLGRPPAHSAHPLTLSIQMVWRLQPGWSAPCSTIEHAGRPYAFIEQNRVHGDRVRVDGNCARSRPAEEVGVDVVRHAHLGKAAGPTRRPQYRG